MIILGIANDETASACLVKDAKVIAAASEERFTRIKMDNSWPENAISYCLDYAGITLDEVDIIATDGVPVSMLKPICCHTLTELYMRRRRTPVGWTFSGKGLKLRLNKTASTGMSSGNL